MSSKRLWCVHAHLFLFLSWLGPTMAVWAQPGTGGKGDYFPLLPGTRWEYRFQVGGETKGSITEMVAAIETINNVPLARLEAQVQGNVVGTEHLRATPQGVFRYRTQGTEIKVPVPVLRYPVKAGDSWEVDTMDQERVKGKVTTSFEVVEVPLGKFKALATDIRFEVQGKPMQSTIWYVEGIGKVKQTLDFGGVQFALELEKFTLGKPQR